MNKQIVFSLLLITSIYSCETDQYPDLSKDLDATSGYFPAPPPVMEEEADYSNAPRTNEPEYASSKARTTSQKENREEKIIKRGYIQAQVKDIHKGKGAIDQIVINHDSYYENESYSDSDYESVYNLSIRIPTATFSSFMTALESSETKIVSKQISSENVTGEYFDIKVALENKEQYLQQYRELLKKTGSIKDLLEVQERIRRLSEEMDVSKGRLVYLDENVKYSTLNLTITQHHERIISRTPNNFGQRIINAFSTGAELIVSIIIFLISIWPFIILFCLFLMFRKRLPTLGNLKKGQKA